MTLQHLADTLQKDRGIHRVSIERRRDDIEGVKVVTCMVGVQAKPEDKIVVLSDVSTNEFGLKRCVKALVSGYLLSGGYRICSPSAADCEYVNGLLAYLDDA